MLKVLKIQSLPGYRIRVRYEDGVEGEVDLSRFAGKGVFSGLTDRAFFEKVHVSPHGKTSRLEPGGGRRALCRQHLPGLDGKKAGGLVPSDIAVARP